MGGRHRLSLVTKSLPIDGTLAVASSASVSKAQLKESSRVAFRYRSLLTVTATVILAAPILALVTGCSSSPGQGNGSAAGASSPVIAVGLPAKGAIPSTPAAGAATISETGSSLIARLFHLWASGYHAKYAGVTVNTASTSSGIGIADASKGLVDIGASHALLSTGNLVPHPKLLNIPLA